MYLHDNLRVCLLALASRYPSHVIDINEAVLGQQKFAAKGWSADEIIEQFERSTPLLLEHRADLTIDECRCVIHLPAYSEELPAFWLHCRGKLPPLRRMIVRELISG
jgi:hypothetical protein